jgi:hypothetical protein
MLESLNRRGKPGHQRLVVGTVNYRIVNKMGSWTFDDPQIYEVFAVAGADYMGKACDVCSPERRPYDYENTWNSYSISSRKFLGRVSSSITSIQNEGLNYLHATGWAYKFGSQLRPGRCNDCRTYADGLWDRIKAKSNVQR